MIPRIKQLPDLIANQIAAGEVVERPASVVKELVENSLDAQSTIIDITINNGGKTLIKITDNGNGIVKEDLPLALTRHATSKISTVAQLQGITSLGFRGEALASIASVSRCKLISAVDNEAWQIEVDADNQASTLLPAAHPKGTTVIIEDLFFNTPVRRKFLKMDRTEFLKIDDIVKRMALSHFAVSFKFTHNDKVILQLPAAITQKQQQQRLQKLLGKNIVGQYHEVLQQAEGLQLSGWVSQLQHAKAHNDSQYFFINGRMVKDKLINHAIRTVAQELLPDGRHLAYTLYLQCDPTIVDVNVHPTKHEVRFQQSRLIHNFVQQSLTKHLKPSVVDLYNAQQATSFEVREITSQFNYIDVNRDEEVNHKFGVAIKQVKTFYLLSESGHGLFLFDLRKARKQLFLSQFNSEATLVSQPLLMPEAIELNEKQFEHIKKLSLADYAIQIKQVAANKVLVTAMPNCLFGCDYQQLFLALIKTKDVVDTLASYAANISTVYDKTAQQRLLNQFSKLDDLPKSCYQHILLEN